MHESRRELIAMLPKQAVGAEIGVWKGEFSAEILKVAAPKTLYLIDPWVIQDNATHRESWYGDAERADMNKIHDNVLGDSQRSGSRARSSSCGNSRKKR